ncbi:unnamed protein product [Dicrocoelium dendriticum]|nr:unnamed protein product [Dicrocoelium dendriticum]
MYLSVVHPNKNYHHQTLLQEVTKANPYVSETSLNPDSASTLQPSKSTGIPDENILKCNLSQLDDKSSLIKTLPSVPVRKQEPNRVHMFRHLREPDKRMDVLSKLGHNVLLNACL